jgi:6-phosphogluconate dehydrogenase, C-terminal domain
LENLLFDDFFNKAIHKAQPSWRDVVAEGARLGIPTPAFSTALSWFDGYRSERLPAGLLQAQRDYFGAHTFRVLPQFKSDKLPEGQDIHVNWVALFPLLIFYHFKLMHGLDWKGWKCFCVELFSLKNVCLVLRNLVFCFAFKFD